MAIYRGTGGWSNTTGTAEADVVVAAQVAVQNALEQVLVSESNTESYKNMAEAAAITATNSATGIEGYATLAATKAVEASASATASANSATASANSANSASTSATLASDWAQKTTGEVVTGQGYSAKYWANAAANAVSDGVIVDTATSTLTTWSSSKIDTDKQNTLVSGTNIKTINGTSVMGSGDITTPTTTVNNTLTSTSTTEALSAAQGKVLQDSKAPSANPSFTGSISEGVYNLTGTEINPANGTIQYATLTADTTFTESLADGQSVTLMLNPSTFTTTWFTVTWIGSKASVAPTLIASVYNCITFFQFGGVVYGKYEGRV